MYKKAGFLIVLTAVLTLCGCATLQQLIDKPVVEFKSMSLQSASLFEATPVFTFKLNNPNPMGIGIDNISYNLKINNQKFVKGVSDQSVRIKAASTGILELPVTFNYMDVFKTVTDFVNNDKVSYNLSGLIAMGPFSLPYQASGEFDVPVLPQVALKDVKVAGLTMTGASVIFDFELENNNNFAINMNALDYSLKLDGKNFVNGTVPDIAPLAQKGKSRVEIPMNLNFFQMGTSLYKVLKDSSTEYELSGSMKFNVPRIGQKSFPFQKNGKVSLRK